jgi:hypothetical protein
VPTESQLLAQLNRVGTKLEKQARHARKLDSYYDASPPFPQAVIKARMTNAYRLLMPLSGAPWGAKVVDSVQDRLEVAGISSGDKTVDDAVWGVWQDNAMDAESKLAHNSALVTGRCYATVWPENGGDPQITLDPAEQMIVQYREGSRRHRVAALRYWVEDDVPHATLYRPEAIYKYVGPKNSSGFSGTQWARRAVAEEEWPLENPYDEVIVVELAVNRRLKPGAFGYARGEFEHCLGLLDRINLLTFLGLVVALWMGFPLRGVLGAKILTDDDGKQIAPFDANVDSIFQIADAGAEIAEFKAADRKNLSITAELAQLAYLTNTPAHYFPLESGISNISADTVVALEGGLHAKVSGHKGGLGQGHLEILRLAGLMLPKPVRLSRRAEVLWHKRESRSLAEMADAAVKLKDILPFQALCEEVLDAGQDKIDRWKTMRADDAISTLIAAAAAAEPAATPAPEPVAA